MKKLLVLMVITITNLTAFSQSAINSSSDTSKIVLTKPIAKAVVKDLLTGDGLSEENNLLRRKIAVLENTIGLKDSLIVTKNDVIDILKLREENLNQVATLKGRQAEEWKTLAEIQKKDIKKLKTRLLLKNILSSALIVTAVGLAIQ